MLDKLFSSKGSRRILLIGTGISLFLCIFSLLTPVFRKKSAMEQTGSRLSMEFSSFALAVSSLEGDSIADSFQASEESDSVQIKQLLDTLSGQYQLHRSYLLGKSVDGKLFYLADSGIPVQDALPAVPGDFYDEQLYSKKCISFAKKVLEEAPPWQGSWYPQPLGEGLAVCYFPITNREGLSVALLGIEVSLDDPDFAQYQFINFHQLALWSGILFVLLLLLCLLVRNSRKTAFLTEQPTAHSSKKKAAKPILTLEAEPEEASEEEP